MNEKNVLDELLAARSPMAYAEAAVLLQNALSQMSDRLAFVTLKPAVVLDMGCAIGESTAMLRQLYPQAHLIAMDSSTAMLDYAAQRLPNVEWKCITDTLLPFPDHSVDLITANFFLPWCDDLEKTLKEWRRILRPEGLVMFTALGPDTLRELHAHPLAFPQLIDMHNLGDLFMQATFVDPVLDVDYFTLTYRDEKKLWRQLQVTGMIAGEVEHIQLEKSNHVYSLTYEIIFGHAWGPSINVNHRVNAEGEVHIPITHLLRK